jgi:hypothetical protein
MRAPGPARWKRYLEHRDSWRRDVLLQPRRVLGPPPRVVKIFGETDPSTRQGAQPSVAFPGYIRLRRCRRKATSGSSLMLPNTRGRSAGSETPALARLRSSRYGVIRIALSEAPQDGTLGYLTCWIDSKTIRESHAPEAVANSGLAGRCSFRKRLGTRAWLAEAASAPASRANSNAPPAEAELCDVGSRLPGYRYAQPVIPPSSGITLPVRYAPAREARNIVRPATSSRRPILPYL